MYSHLDLLWSRAGLALTKRSKSSTKSSLPERVPAKTPVQTIGAFVVSILLLNLGCASKPVNPTTPSVTPPVNPTALSAQESIESGANDVAVVDTGRIKALDTKALEKGKLVFVPLINNDEKKAKLAYGRNHRYLPDTLKFVFDLRFKNYEHAQTLVDKLDFDNDQKAFWQRIVSAKPNQLSQSVCQDLSKQNNYPSDSSRISDSEAAWFAYFEDLDKQTVDAARKGQRTKGELDQVIDQISCDSTLAKPDVAGCKAIEGDLRNEIFKDSFFDKLHNLKRRDVRAAGENAKNLMKQGLYTRYVSSINIFKLWRAVKADTGYERQMHFLRRFNSIARDMRPESGLSRVLGDIMINDNEDLTFARRLNAFAKANSLTVATAAIAHDLAQCHLSSGKQKATLSSVKTNENDKKSGDTEAAEGEAQ